MSTGNGNDKPQITIPGSQQWLINQVSVSVAYLRGIHLSLMLIRKRLNIIIVILIAIAVGVWVH